MKLKNLIIPIIFLFSFTSVISPDPYTHIRIVDVFCEHTDNPEAQWCCQNERNLMYAGAMVPDSMIQDYYKGGGTNYRKMHNWRYTLNLIDSTPVGDKQGVCYSKSHIFHQVPDGVSHNWIVPVMMDRWNMPNELVHIPTEYAMGVSVLKHNPNENWFEKGATSLESLLEPGNERFIQWEQNQMGVGSGIDMKSRVNGLIYFVGGNKFFSEGYNPAPETDNKRYIRINLFWGILSLIILILGLYLTKVSLNRGKTLLILSVPMILIGSLILLGSFLAITNEVTVISYAWKFFYKGLGGIISKDEGDLIGASMVVLEDIWEDPHGKPSKILYKGEEINITEPHGFTALGYGSGGTSFTRLITWIVIRFLILLIIIFGIRYGIKFLRNK